ncbi:MAG: Ribosomal L32p protein family [Pseudomonadota bacterium]|jgi:ribosomal protein L32
MATPKKKISKSRRNMRRKSAVYRADPITTVLSPITHEPTRPHRMTLETIDQYIAQKKRHKELRRTNSTSTDE